MTIPAAPVRYRLARPLAITWRCEGVLQLGLDGDGLVLEGVPAAAAHAVGALAEPRSLSELSRLVPDLPDDWLGWLVGRLTEARLVTTAQVSGDRLGLVGGGPLADATASLLKAAGLTELVRVSPGPARPRSPRGTSSVLTPALHWSQLGQDWPGLTIVATDTQEPDRSLTDALARAGQAHLVVRLEADRAVVGPLVVPGATPCVRCQDLLRCRCDAAWPMLVAQLCRDRAGPDRVLLAWAVATTVAQVRCHLAGGAADVVGRTLELGTDNVLRTREWPVHPDCGCVLAVA